MKIYTKKGDSGQTRIIGKKILYKDDIRIKSYGGIDELNSWIGYVHSLIAKNTKQFESELEEIQQLLFDCGNDLATLNDDSRHKFIFPKDATNWLEKKIDFYSTNTPEVKKFILPGGSQLAAGLHVARTITRRVERDIVELQQKEEINQDVLMFINRLSDYFFAAARYANVLEKTDEIFYRNSKDIFR